jgi:hypothetical protein
MLMSMGSSFISPTSIRTSSVRSPFMSIPLTPRPSRSLTTGRQRSPSPSAVPVNIRCGVTTRHWTHLVRRPWMRLRVRPFVGHTVLAVTPIRSFFRPREGLFRSSIVHRLSFPAFLIPTFTDQSLLKIMIRRKKGKRRTGGLNISVCVESRGKRNKSYPVAIGPTSDITHKRLYEARRP